MKEASREINSTGRKNLFGLSAPSWLLLQNVGEFHAVVLYILSPVPWYFENGPYRKENCCMVTRSWYFLIHKFHRISLWKRNFNSIIRKISKQSHSIYSMIKAKFPKASYKYEQFILRIRAPWTRSYTIPANCQTRTRQKHRRKEQFSGTIRRHCRVKAIVKARRDPSKLRRHERLKACGTSAASSKLTTRYIYCGRFLWVVAAAV